MRLPFVSRRKYEALIESGKARCEVRDAKYEVQRFLTNEAVKTGLALVEENKKITARRDKWKCRCGEIASERDHWKRRAERAEKLNGILLAPPKPKPVRGPMWMALPRYVETATYCVWYVPGEGGWQWRKADPEQESIDAIAKWAKENGFEYEITRPVEVNA